ncbi:sodium:solute symporter family protein [Micrococcaceae bacterium Sec7.4]
MNMTIAYGLVGVFFAVVIAVLELTKRKADTLTDYAVAGRSFGPWFQTMSFLNTWLPGTVFISFAGLAASSGLIGYYLIFYSLIAIVLMYFMADKVHAWGRIHDLRTQADFVGMRYGSRTVRVVAAVIGVVSMFPWLILGFQSLGLVFSYLSFGAISASAAIFVGIGVLAVRQIWTVRMGMRGIVISDMVQGIAAYGLGFVMAVGFIVWLVGQGLGFDRLPSAFLALPGMGSELGPLYFFSIVLTGSLGAWCWPDIFVRLFTAKDARTTKKSSAQAAPLLLLFAFAVITMALLAHALPSVAEAPDNVWFIVASNGGVVVLALAGIAVLAATMGNVSAIAAASGTQVTQDILQWKSLDDKRRVAHAKIAITAISALAIVGAVITANTVTGLVSLAMTSYQGIVQLAPALYLGLFWKRGTAAGATLGMLVGFATAAILQILYPISIGWLLGLTSGVVGLIANTAVYMLCSLVKPPSVTEQLRVDELFIHAYSDHKQDPSTTTEALSGRQSS